MGHFSEVLRRFFEVALGTGCICAVVSIFTCVEAFYAGVSDYLSMNALSNWRHPFTFSSFPLLNNCILLILFYSSHSLLARDWFKGLTSSIFSPSTYHKLYIVISTTFLLLIYYGWSPQPLLVWDVEWLPARYTLYGMALLGLAVSTVGLISLKPLEFVGIQEHLDRLRGASTKTNNLVVNCAYSHVRHPVLTGLLIALWAQPTMSEGHLLFSIAFSVYWLVATLHLEKPNLIKLLGQQYKSYMQNTPN